MGYIQDKVKEALGGSKLMNAKSDVIQGWTPNNIRVIVISKSYILVVHHISNTYKIVNLDTQKVIEEVEKSSRGVSNLGLMSIFKRRSFSCLEELYVDPIYLTGGILNLDEYIKQSSNGVSRLRQVGCGDLGNSLDLLKSASRVKYSLVGNILKGVKIKNLNNETWYEKYYLRPQFYNLDKQGGNLDMHFKKVENDYLNWLKENKEKADKNSLLNAIDEIASRDLDNMSFLESFAKIIAISKSDEEIKSTVHQACISTIDKFSSPVIGLKEKFLVRQEFLINIYRFFKVFDNSEKKLDKKVLSEFLNSKRGFIDISSILDTVCTTVSKKLYSKYPDLIKTSLVMNKDNIPNGVFRDTFFQGQSNDCDCKGFINFICDLIGEAI